MKAISDNDLSLLLTKLPLALAVAKRHRPSLDLQTANAIRRLEMLSAKLQKIHLKNKNK